MFFLRKKDLSFQNDRSNQTQVVLAFSKTEIYLLETVVSERIRIIINLQEKCADNSYNNYLHGRFLPDFWTRQKWSMVKTRWGTRVTTSVKNLPDFKRYWTTLRNPQCLHKNATQIMKQLLWSILWQKLWKLKQFKVLNYC